MQEKFRHVRDRLKGNLPFHGSGWGKIINCRQTRVKEGSVVQLLDLEVQADAIPIVDFPIQTMMIFLARYMSTELVDEAPHVPAPSRRLCPRGSRIRDNSFVSGCVHTGTTTTCSPCSIAELAISAELRCTVVKAVATVSSARPRG